MTMNPFHINLANEHSVARIPDGSVMLGTKPSNHQSTDPIKQQLLDIAWEDHVEQLQQQGMGHSIVSPVAGTEPQLPPDDTPPNSHQQILIAQNFLSDEICDEYITYIRNQPEVDLSVFDPQKTNKTGSVEWRVDKETRDTQTVPIEPILQPLEDLMRYATQQFLNPFFNVRIASSEFPQILVYHPGGHYKPHIDGESLFNDGSGVLTWKRNVDRDISMVIYLNDDYEGGEIVFPQQAISIKPRKGMLLAFPSHHQFLHGVNPVRNGVRYAIVNWFSLGQHPKT